MALVARRPERLESLVTELAAEGIEAASFPADLSAPESIPAGRSFTSATQLTAAGLQELLPLYPLTPVEVVQAVLPEMIERGDGAILLTHGFSAMMPAPHFSGPGPVTSAAWNYLHSLNGELAGTGVYAGTINVAGAIARSENAPAKVEAVDEGSAFEGMAFPVIDPDDIAARYWDMYTDRQQVEAIIPEMTFGQ